MRLSSGLLIVLVLSLLADDAAACSVPVFRYALERWPSDLFEVDVFHRGKLTDEQRALVSKLEDRSLINGGDRNWEIIDCDLAGDLDADLQTVWDGLTDVPLPHVVIRCPGGRQGSPQIWVGPLSSIEARLADSRPEQELVRRLLSGDSVVWVVLRGTDAVSANSAVKRLTEQLPTVMSDIELPAGVGLPGSELLSRIPLEVKASVLDVAAEDANRTWLRRTAEAWSKTPVDAAATIIMPVFGRGRAVQVLTADEIDTDVIGDLSQFLCGACSCQVKQANPGFDLLLPVGWDERLYGAEVPAAAIAETPGSMPTEPTYIAIPTGEVAPASTKSMTARPETPLDVAANRAAESAEAQSEATESSPLKTQSDWFLLGASVLMVGILYAWRRQAAWSRRNAQNG